MSFYRTPSPLEFSYIAADLPDYSPLVNQFFVVGDGNIELTRMRDALKQAVAANPGYGLRLKGLWGWRYWDDSGADPSVDEIHAPEWDSSTSLNAPCLGEPISVKTDPLCQVKKIHAKNGTHILFRTHHAITDGRGTVHLMNETFRILRGEAPLGSHSKATEWDVAMSQERPARPIVEGDCLPVIKGTVTPENTGYQWARFDWKGDKNKLAAKLIFAVSQIARNNFGEGKILIRIPADLRRYLPENEGLTIANCSGAIDMEIAADTKLNTIRSQIIKSMRQKEDLSPFQDNHKYAKWLPKSMFRQHPETLKKTHQEQRYRMTGIISYMGEVNNDDFRCDTFTPTSQFGVPIAFENRPMFIAACSYNDVTNIIVGCPKAVASLDELGNFNQKLAQQLDAL